MTLFDFIDKHLWWSFFALFATLSMVSISVGHVARTIAMVHITRAVADPRK